MERTIQCSILTPEHTLYEGEVGFAVVQAFDGEMGFLFNHSPLISELGVGEVRLSDSNSTESFFVEGGVVEIKDNKMIVLAESAIKSSELNTEDAEKKLNELSEQTFEKYSDDRLIIQAEVNKMKMRLKVAKKLQK